MFDRTQLRDRLREGLPVYSAEDQELGRIERIDDDSITVNGQQYEFSAIERIERDRLYLTRQVGPSLDQGQMRTAATGERREERVEAGREVRVPEVEERLDVEKRPVEIGEVRVQKTVEEERQTVPVELMQEEVHVERRDVPERPLGPGEQAFQEDTIRVPVRAEEAVARKEAVVTGEVVINKERTTQTEEVGDTVRRTEVHVDRGGEVVQPEGQDVVSATDRSTPGTAGIRDRERVEAGSREGSMLAASPAGSTAGTLTAVAEGTEVIGADGERIGRVKEVRDGDFLVDRTGQRDVYVPTNAVADVREGAVRLTVAAAEVDDQGWANPPLL